MTKLSAYPSAILKRFQSVPLPKSASSSWLSSVPLSPGVYIFADAAGKIKYLGKSISLRSRARQHLQTAKNPHSKSSRFIARSSTYQYLVTKSDLQAIILEAYLIKTTKPYYNSLSKDDKSSIYLAIDNFPFPKITLIRATDINSHHYHSFKHQVYGPFLSLTNTKIVLKTIRQIFGYCQNPFNSQAKPCFNYHLHQCPGPCCQGITPEKYRLHLNKISRFLSGNFDRLEKNLRRQIKLSAAKQNFEQAQSLKNQLERFQKAMADSKVSGFLNLPQTEKSPLKQMFALLNHPQLLAPPRRIECFDVAHWQQQQLVGSLSVLINGQPAPSGYRHFILQNQSGGDTAALREIVSRRLSHPDWPLPNLILLDGGPAQLSQVYPLVPKSIPLLSLSKKQETLHFFRQGKIVSLNLSRHHSVLKIFQVARDEAHRFATTFHQKKRRLAILK